MFRRTIARALVVLCTTGLTVSSANACTLGSLAAQTSPDQVSLTQFHVNVIMEFPMLTTITSPKIRMRNLLKLGLPAPVLE